MIPFRKKDRQQMTRFQRIENIAVAAVMIVCGILIALRPGDGLRFSVLVLSISLALSGIRYLVYYFTLARYMVGGKALLFAGVFLLDAGAFLNTLLNERFLTLLIYLIAVYLFAGLVDVLRAYEAKRLNAPLWKFKLALGLAEFLTAVFCVLFSGNMNVLSLVYCAGLIYSGLVRFVSVFRRTGIVYVQ